jgi:predicted DNA-binding protein
VPNQPRTPTRSFRIPDDIYEPAKEKAESEGRTITDVVRDLLLDYVGDEDDVSAASPWL